eukprot:m.44337 g.44337  ORF g.44337 m.44337 type:complete len:1235 (+) comp10829_c0_seq4:119-3823(+)
MSRPPCTLQVGALLNECSLRWRQGYLATTVLVTLAIIQSPCVSANANLASVVRPNVVQTVSASTQQVPGLSWHTSELLMLEDEPLLAVFGGVQINDGRPQARGDTYIFSQLLRVWSLCHVVSSERPRGRFQHVSAANHLNNTMLMFGGGRFKTPSASPTVDPQADPLLDLDIELLDDLWELTVERGSHEESLYVCHWRQLHRQDEQPWPSARAAPASTFNNNHLFLHGGCETVLDPQIAMTLASDSAYLYICVAEHRLNDMWQFSFETQEWKELDVDGQYEPGPRVTHLMFVLDNTKLVFFGGHMITNDELVYDEHYFICTPKSGTADFSSGFSCDTEPVSGPVMVTRGSVTVSQGGEFAYVFGVTSTTDKITASRVSIQGTQLVQKDVELRNYLVVPSANSFTAGLIPRGGFTVTHYGNVDEVWLVGDVFDTISGDRATTWLARLSHPSPTDTTLVWNRRFFFTRASARALMWMGEIDGELVVLGGFSGVITSTAWVFKPTGVTPAAETGLPTPQGTWTRLEPLASAAESPAPRYGHFGAVLSPSSILVASGIGGNNQFDTTAWQFNMNTLAWHQVSGQSPARSGARSALANGYIYVVGGVGPDHMTTSTVYRAHIEAQGPNSTLNSLTWETVATSGVPLPPRAYFAMQPLLNLDGNLELVVFGGARWTYFPQRSSTAEPGKWFALNLETHVWRNYMPNVSDLPRERTYTCSVQMGTHRMLFMGGQAGTRTLDDIWSYDHRRQTVYQLRSTPSTNTFFPARYGHSCAVLQQTIYAMGGASTNAYFSDLLSIVPTCNAGSDGNYSTDSCRACPRGSFREDLAVPDCVQCGQGLTTNTHAAQSASLCRECEVDYCKRGSGKIQPVEDELQCLCSCPWGVDGIQCEKARGRHTLFGALFGIILTILLLAFVRRMYKKREKVVLQDNALKERLLEESAKEIMELEAIWEIHPEELEKRRNLDEGGFGLVYLAYWRTQDKLVAVKELRQAILELDANSRDDFVHEVKFIRSLRHRNIVWFYGANTVGTPFLVMEYVSRGCLTDLLLDSTTSIADEVKHQFMLDAARGMEYLHSRSPPRIHRDLKSQNLLVSESNVIKVTDFTTAKQLFHDSHQAHHNVGAILDSSQQELGSALYETTTMGTLPYCAPEVLRSAPYGLAVDVYAFGVTMNEIIVRQLPFSDYKGKIARHVLDGGRPTTLEDCNPEWLKLLQQCWHTNPTDRPSFTKVVEQLTIMSTHLK